MNTTSDFIEVHNTDYLISLVKGKQWDRIFQVIVDQPVFCSLMDILNEEDLMKQTVIDMPKETLLKFIQTVSQNPTQNRHLGAIFSKMEKLCDENEKLTSVAYEIIKAPHAYPGAPQNALSCLPTDVIAKLANARIPRTDFKFGNTSFAEQLMYALDGKHSFKDLQERDAHNYLQIYINTKREKVVDTYLDCLQESLKYVETLDWKSPLIYATLEHISGLINRSFSVWNSNQKLIEKLKSIITSFPLHKVFPTMPYPSVLNGNGNRSLSIININFNQLEIAGVIPTNYYYTVFKNAVEHNSEEFMKIVSENFITNNRSMRYLRDAKDGIFQKLFDATVERVVKDFVERSNSYIFQTVANDLFPNQMRDENHLLFDEGVKFINEVCKKIIAKKSAVSTNANTYPNICLEIIHNLSLTGGDVDAAVNASPFRTPIELLERETRNSIVLGAIRHPTEETKFSQYIKSNHNTALVGLICKLATVADIALVLPEKKRASLDKYSFMPGKVPGVDQATRMSIVEVFLTQMKFWESKNFDHINRGYNAYINFVNKMLYESLLSNDAEFQKAALSSFERLLYLIANVPNATNTSKRMQVLANVIANPIAMHFGSTVDKKLAKRIVDTVIPKIPSQFLATILIAVMSGSHYDGYQLDAPCAELTAAILKCLSDRPPKNFNVNLEYREFPQFAKNKWQDVHKDFLGLNEIIPVCNPLLTDHAAEVLYSGPTHVPDNQEDLSAKLSQAVWFEVVKAVNAYAAVYQPIEFETERAKMFISLRQFAIDHASAPLVKYIELKLPSVFGLEHYFKVSGESVRLIYNQSYFPMIKELYPDAIFDFATVKKLYEFVFLDEKGALKNVPPPPFDGFEFQIYFKQHPHTPTVCQERDFQNILTNYKFNTLNNVVSAANNYYENATQYNTAQLVGEKLEEVFKAEKKFQKSERKTTGQGSYAVAEFQTIFEALNKCNASEFYESRNSLNTLQQFYINNFESFRNAPMITALLDLIIKDLAAPRLTKKLGKNVVTFHELEEWANNCIQIGTYSLGKLQNLGLLAKLSDNTVHERFSSPSRAFRYIVDSKNVDNIVAAMNCYFFADDANYLAQNIIPTYEVIDRILKGATVLDEFIVPLCAAAVDSQVVGFPAPAAYVDFLKFAAKRGVECKRAAVANAAYYCQLHSQCGLQIPEIFEVFEIAQKGNADEMTVFFCLLCAYQATYSAIRNIPALSEFTNHNIHPAHYTPNSTDVTIPKELGAFYEKVVDSFIINGLLSTRSEYVELATAVLGEMNLGEGLPARIAPFIEKGLNGLSPGEDNKSFIKFATSFAALHEEFPNCYTAYESAIKTLSKHSYKILRENARRKKDSEYPESFTKLGADFTTIADAVGKVFTEFKEPKEMVATSKFCRKVLKTFEESTPAVAVTEFLNLVTTVSYFGDENVEKLVAETDKKTALTHLIRSFANHADLCNYLPVQIGQIYGHLNSTFAPEHVIELSKLPRSLQRATNLSSIFVNDVLQHLPEGSDDELTDIIAKLGIFARNDVAPALVTNGGPMFRRHMMKCFAAPAAPMECCDMALGAAAPMAFSRAGGAPPPPCPPAVAAAPMLCSFAAAPEPQAFRAKSIDIDMMARNEIAPMALMAKAEAPQAEMMTLECADAVEDDAEVLEEAVALDAPMVGMPGPATEEEEFAEDVAEPEGEGETTEQTEDILDLWN